MDDDRGNIDVDGALDRCLKTAGKRALWGIQTVDLCNYWQIRFVRGWSADALPEEVEDKMNLELYYTGPLSSNDRIVSTVKCQEMIDVVGGCAKLIEDCKLVKISADGLKISF